MRLLLAEVGKTYAKDWCKGGQLTEVTDSSFFYLRHSLRDFSILTPFTCVSYFSKYYLIICIL